MTHMERVTGIEPVSSAWKADIKAIIRYPRPEDHLYRSLVYGKWKPLSRLVFLFLHGFFWFITMMIGHNFFVIEPHNRKEQYRPHRRVRVPSHANRHANCGNSPESCRGREPFNAVFFMNNGSRAKKSDASNNLRRDSRSVVGLKSIYGENGKQI